MGVDWVVVGFSKTIDVCSVCVPTSLVERQRFVGGSILQKYDATFVWFKLIQLFKCISKLEHPLFNESIDIKVQNI